MWWFMNNTFSNPVISLKNITKQYRIGHVNNIVLHNISLNLNTGDMLAIVGASGSGKSTLMNLIGLLDKADSGQYQLKGLNIADLTDDALAFLRNQCIGFVFQQFNLLPRFTVLQNVALPLTYRRTAPSIALKKAYGALGRVGMQAFTAYRPMQLSGGQQQRVAIARALVGDPQVILADEPTGALDSNTSDEIMALFLSLHAEGRTLILITHDEHVASMCTRQIILADGKIVAGALS